MAAVDADPDPLAAAGGIDEHRELVEVATERSRRAGRVLEQDRALLGLGESLANELARTGDRFVDRVLLAGPGVEDDAVGADRVAEAKRVGQRGQ